MKYAGTYVNLETDTGWFDWKSFKKSLDQYEGDNLTLDEYQEVTIDHQERTVKTMVDQIVKFLSKGLGVVVSQDEVDKLTSFIKVTFTNLKEKSSHGFLDFNKSTDETNSAWEYRIQFAFPNPDTGDEFYALVTTIKLEANIREKSEWWGLKSDTSKNFAAEIKALRLVVVKGFKNHH